jgi:hypothetical protein
MPPISIWLKAFIHCAETINLVLFDLLELVRLVTKSRSAVVLTTYSCESNLRCFRNVMSDPTAPRIRPDG